jgi:N-acyl amino acid synthase of PEP-CTERM/exosortase system
MKNPSISSVFNRYFSVVPADTQELIEEVYHIRHQVYCDELGFEKRRTNHLEFDEYDLRSIHCLLFHKPSNSYAGCIRLILADSQSPDTPFPFELVCGDPYKTNYDHLANQSRLNHGEISRLAITSDFRRRRGESNTPDGGNDNIDTRENDERRQFPSVALGLYLAITAMGLKLGLNGVFAMMEPRLARQLKRFGFIFEQMGETIEHRGQRAPFYIDRQTLFDNLKPEYLELLNDILATIQPINTRPAQTTSK